MTTQTTRPGSVVFALVLLGFLAATALGGGIEMLLFPHGNEFVPGEWLEGIPLVRSWIVPGLILAFGFGAGSLVVGWGLLRKPRWGWLHRTLSRNRLHWSWMGCILLGMGLISWIGLELLLIPKRSVVEVIYGAVGLALIITPLLPASKRYLRLSDEPE